MVMHLHGNQENVVVGLPQFERTCKCCQYDTCEEELAVVLKRDNGNQQATVPPSLAVEMLTATY